MTTFDFGFGPTPAHRHKNPDGTKGGWVSESSSVSDDSIVSEDSTVSDMSEVSGSTIIHSRIYSFSTVRGSTVEYKSIPGLCIINNTVQKSIPPKAPPSGPMTRTAVELVNQTWFVRTQNRVADPSITEEAATLDAEFAALRAENAKVKEWRRKTQGRPQKHTSRRK